MTCGRGDFEHLERLIRPGGHILRAPPGDHSIAPAPVAGNPEVIAGSGRLVGDGYWHRWRRSDQQRGEVPIAVEPHDGGLGSKSRGKRNGNPAHRVAHHVPVGKHQAVRWAVQHEHSRAKRVPRGIGNHDPRHRRVRSCVLGAADGTSGGRQGRDGCKQGQQEQSVRFHLRGRSGGSVSCCRLRRRASLARILCKSSRRKRRSSSLRTVERRDVLRVVIGSLISELRVSSAAPRYGSPPGVCLRSACKKCEPCCILCAVSAADLRWAEPLLTRLQGLPEPTEGPKQGVFPRRQNRHSRHVGLPECRNALEAGLGCGDGCSFASGPHSFAVPDCCGWLAPRAWPGTESQESMSRAIEWEVWDG